LTGQRAKIKVCAALVLAKFLKLSAYSALQLRLLDGEAFPPELLKLLS
jgi:hypothetical protein